MLACCKQRPTTLQQPFKNNPYTCLDRGVDIEVDSSGLGISLIDFTLARLRMPVSGAVVFFNLDSDPELFEGPRGDCQVPGRPLLPSNNLLGRQQPGATRADAS